MRKTQPLWPYNQNISGYRQKKYRILQYFFIIFIEFFYKRLSRIRWLDIFWTVFLRNKGEDFHFSSEERESTRKITIEHNFFLSL
jgi:hypothetical protein